jgi:hypothetical protein
MQIIIILSLLVILNAPLPLSAQPYGPGHRTGADSALSAPLTDMQGGAVSRPSSPQATEPVQDHRMIRGPHNEAPSPEAQPSYPYGPFHNPYYGPADSGRAMAGYVDWVLNLPSNLLGRVSNILDRKVFPATPATNGVGAPVGSKQP